MVVVNFFNAIKVSMNAVLPVWKRLGPSVGRVSYDGRIDFHVFWNGTMNNLQYIHNFLKHYEVAYAGARFIFMDYNAITSWQDCHWLILTPGYYWLNGLTSAITCYKFDRACFGHASGLDFKPPSPLNYPEKSMQMLRPRNKSVSQEKSFAIFLTAFREPVIHARIGQTSYTGR